MQINMKLNVISCQSDVMDATDSQGKPTRDKIHWGNVRVLEPVQSTANFAGVKPSKLKIVADNPEDILKIGSAIRAEIEKQGAPCELELQGGQALESVTKNGKTETVSMLVVTGFTPKK